MDIVRLALYPPCRTIPPASAIRQDEEGYIPPSELVLRFKPDRIPKGSALRADMASAMQETSSPEVFQYLRNVLGQVDNSPAALGKLQAENAGFGDMVMIRHLLNSGVDVMVELLLRMGVGTGEERRSILYVAKAKGLESMVDILKSCEEHPDT